MVVKDYLRNAISKNYLLHFLFVSFCARFTVRLLSLQSYLSFEDIRAKYRQIIWRSMLSMLKKKWQILDKVVIGNDISTFYYKNGLAFRAINSSSSLSVLQYAYDDYAGIEIKFLEKVIKPNWIVVDAGANFGRYAIHFSKMVGPQGKVLAFEPIQPTFNELCENTNLNACENLQTENLALGNFIKKIKMYYPCQMNQGAGAASQFLDTGKEVYASMITLDDYVQKKGITKIDFIKADIEGGELNMLKGAENILARHHPQIFIEIADVHCKRFQCTPEEVVKFLTERGYEGKYLHHDGTLLAFDHHHPPSGNFYFSYKFSN